jgi:hypothetical protein
LKAERAISGAIIKGSLASLGSVGVLGMLAFADEMYPGLAAIVPFRVAVIDAFVGAVTPITKGLAPAAIIAQAAIIIEVTYLTGLLAGVPMFLLLVKPSRWRRGMGLLRGGTRCAIIHVKVPCPPGRRCGEAFQRLILWIAEAEESANVSRSCCWRSLQERLFFWSTFDMSRHNRQAQASQAHPGATPL